MVACGRQIYCTILIKRWVSHRQSAIERDVSFWKGIINEEIIKQRNRRIEEVITYFHIFIFQVNIRILQRRFSIAFRGSALQEDSLL